MPGLLDYSQKIYVPIWPPQTPKTFSSQRITAMITTIFKIDLMDDAIGM